MPHDRVDRPPRELVLWTVLVLIGLLGYVGVRVGRCIGRSSVFGESFAPAISVPIILLMLVMFLYRSVFCRVFHAITVHRIWLLPLLFGGFALLVIAADAPPPVKIGVVLTAALLTRLVYLEYQWQNYLLAHEILPQVGFTLRDVMWGIVGISIVLAGVRYGMLRTMYAPLESAPF
ncbi:hypothetical protein C5Y93_02760 [Blastopirellula marina]|uniref:Uncharacterized protein n=2 Tax=Blastopirellula marina TaxID=124 RepID=A0A2S8GT46_9BACT|nr:hypothetical protein C5Y93_02760 [Blastopirellula marina]